MHDWDGIKDWVAEQMTRPAVMGHEVMGPYVRNLARLVKAEADKTSLMMGLLSAHGGDVDSLTSEEAAQAFMRMRDLLVEMAGACSNLSRLIPKVYELKREHEL